MTIATRRSLLSGDAPRDAATVVRVIRSATAVAAATCSCIVLLSEFGARPTVACAAAVLGSVVPETAAAALLFGSRGVLNDGGGSGTRVAENSAFAVTIAGVAVLAR